MVEMNGTDVPPSKVLTILGCGSLGSAVLYGLLASTAGEDKENVKGKELSNGHGPPRSKDEIKLDKPTRFIACVRTPKSAARLKDEMAIRFPNPVPVTISHGDNVHAVQAASTVLLGCEPQDVSACLGEPGLALALRNKLLISIIAGVTIPQLEEHLRQHQPPTDLFGAPTMTKIIRAMPNTSALHNSSTTLIAAPPSIPPEYLDLANTLLSTIGTVTCIQASLFDAYTALCGSTPPLLRPRPRRTPRRGGSAWHKT